MQERTASCRICAGQCGLRFSLDEDERIIQIRGDKRNPVTRGYACIKGLTLHEAHYSPERILHPLRRTKDGGFVRVPMAEALDEIAERICAVIASKGPDAVAGFRGTMSYTNSIMNQMLPDWLAGIGSHSFFSTMTIDQSAKWVTAERLGTWEAGKDPYDQADVLLLFGTNPIVSLSTFNVQLQNPVKAMREAKARGVTVILVDPRRSETGAFADIVAQPLPGEDATLVAGMLRIIFAEGWTDSAFCAAHVAGLDRLRQAVEPFTTAYVEERTGIAAGSLRAITEAFAAPLPHRRKRGSAASGTGPNMSAHSNLSEHLIECLNVVCGRYARSGDRVANPGVLGPRWPRRAQVRPPSRCWESGWRDARGFGRIFGERMSATLPDAILSDEHGCVRALIVDGGNPANCFPAIAHARRALASLDLLVAIEPFMTETAALAHFVLPPTMMLERHDIGARDWETFTLFAPYAQYSEPVIAPPPGSELIEDWRVLWELARRTGHPITFDGVPLDMETPPDSEALLRLLLRNSAVPADAIRAATAGNMFEVETMTVSPADGDARFEVAPDDVMAELANVRAEQRASGSLRFAVRRIRDVQNSMYHDLPGISARIGENPVWMNAEDMADRGLYPGTRVRLSSGHGAVTGTVVADSTLRRGVVSMTHGWGGKRGANINAITSLHDGNAPINAMPVLSGFAVEVEPE